jgi:molybdopterin-synthase adenylyltransferase
MKKIIIVGVGALGSHLVQLLRNVDATIKVIDYDRVEHKNVHSQFHGKPHVGRLKVDAVKASMALMWGTKTEIIGTRLGMANAHSILCDSDLIVDCLDNAHSRQIVIDYAKRKEIPCVHGALAADGAFGRVIWDPDFKVDSEDVPGQATCDEGDHLAFIACVSSYLAMAVAGWLRDDKKINYSVSLRNAFAH